LRHSEKPASVSRNRTFAERKCTRSQQNRSV